MNMNTPKTEIKRWGIVIIQSLGQNDKKTGKDLFDDVIRYKDFYDNKCFSAFYDANSKLDFKNHVQSIYNSLQVGDILTLHIETHGSDDGIVLNNGELIPWKEFYDLTRPINIKIGHLLLVVMAMCKSIAMISSINPYDRAPYRAFICSTRKVFPEELYNGFVEFYSKYNNLLDSFDAIALLQNEVKDENGYSPFQILSCESVFDETFKENLNRDELVVKQLRLLGIPVTCSTKEKMHEVIHNLLKDIHDSYYNYYNFKDLY